MTRGKTLENALKRKGISKESETQWFAIAKGRLKWRVETADSLQSPITNLLMPDRSNQENRRFSGFSPTFGRHMISGIWSGLRENPAASWVFLATGLMPDG